MGWFGVPTASQHFQFAAGQRLDQARHRRGSASPGARSPAFPVECLHQPGQAAERDALGWSLFCLGDGQSAEQGTHQRRLAGDDLNSYRERRQEHT
jgi:hypothetical protein